LDSFLAVGRLGKLSLTLAIVIALGASGAIADSGQAARLKRAQTALNLCDFGKVKQILAGDHSVPALLLVAEAYRGAESTDGKPLLVAAQKLAPKNSAVLTGLAWISLRDKDYEIARGKLEEALKIDPASLDAQSMLGRCLYKDGKKDDGLKMMKDVLQKAPTNVAVNLELAKTFSDEREQPKAEELLTKLIAAHSHDILPRLKRADIYNDDGKKDDAIKDLQEALKLNPHCQAAFSKRARILQEQKQYDKALADCAECLNQKDGMENIGRKCLRTKVRCEEKLHRNTNAIADLKVLTKGIESETVKWNDGSQESYIKLTANYERLKQYPNALKSIAVVQRFVPASTEAMAYKARILSEMDKNKESLTEYDKLVATNPAKRDWRLDRAKVMRKLGQNAAADQETKAAQSLKD
jgi:tetratricopeptide (TPR) repeat protein